MTEKTGMNLNPDSTSLLKRLLAKVKRLLRRGDPAGTETLVEVPSPTVEPACDERFIDGRFEHRFGHRDYKLYIPPSAAGWRPVPRPLVLMLHGCTQTPEDFAIGTRMNDAARAGGFLVLYPAQSALANLHRCWNWFKHNHQQRDRGEAALLADLTRAVAQAHGVDPGRIYVAGLSAGGAMAAVLGNAYPELFAAVGLHSGVPIGLARDMTSAMLVMKSGPIATTLHMSAPPPTVIFHGDRDTVVHPANADQAMRPFESLGTRHTTKGQTEQGVAYTCHRVRDHTGRVLAEQWNVQGIGHAWSGGSAAGTYTLPAGPDATTAMVAFFEGQRLAGLAEGEGSTRPTTPSLAPH